MKRLFFGMFCILILNVLFSSSVSADCVEPYSGMTITEDTNFCSGEYELNEAIFVTGDHDIEIECEDTVLVGDNESTGFFIRDTEDVEIEDCILKDFSKGIDAQYVDDLYFENSFLGNMNSGIVVLDSDSLLIEEVEIENVRYGVETNDVDEVSIYDGLINGIGAWYGTGVYIRDADNMEIHHLTIKNYDTGIFTQDVDFVEIGYNVLISIFDINGIWIEYSDEWSDEANIEIEEVRIQHGQIYSTGIALINAPEADIGELTVTDVDTGLLIENSSNVSIFYSNFFDNEERDISIVGDKIRQGTKHLIRYSNIWSPVGIWNDQPYEVDARQNYWNTENISEIAERIAGLHSPEVVYDPFLSYDRTRVRREGSGGVNYWGQGRVEVAGTGDFEVRDGEGTLWTNGADVDFSTHGEWEDIGNHTYKGWGGFFIRTHTWESVVWEGRGEIESGGDGWITFKGFFQKLVDSE